jgi:hypothetical protein|tara:strand:- start:40 stop:705 length:666 start_codon:yes stop_codon:yes gene_type:complete
MLHQFIATEPKRTSGPPFCYQQGESDCGYYSLRIAAEIALKRRFDSEEDQTFRQEFLNMCLVSGQRLEFSVMHFAEQFPDMSVYFTTEADVPEFSPTTVIEKLDAGCKAVVLNIQNMDFAGNRLTRGRYGHNICCVGHGKGKLIFADSNRNRGSCRKTMDIELLQKGFEDIQNVIQHSSDEHEARQKLERRTRPTRIVEMFWVNDTLPCKKIHLRRSRRKK